ncbi:SPOR domain-containing protein [Massilia brevitalea]|uniref:SPOR domain-containing protein n=1 Tax=Massilia brevitalea TaxID=442526 RepID=UPI002739152E
MVKFVFWALLAANALLFAYGRGLLGSADGELREPARLTKQLAADKLVLLSGEQAQALAAAAKAEDGAAEAETEVEEAPAPAPPAPETPAYACLETEAFAPPDARRFENRLARLELGARQMRLAVPFQEVTSHLVYLPPNGGKEGAERRVAELRERGISDYFIMQGDSPMRWAVSLGAFKTEASARTLAAELAKKGVQGVRVLPRGPQSNRFAYRFRDIDGPTRARILEAGRGMEATILHICK